MTEGSRFAGSQTGYKPAAVKMLLYGSYRKVLDNQRNFVAKERTNAMRGNYARMETEIIVPIKKLPPHKD